jgi:menaquinone-dependent protoporphyrinogen oxidase
MRTVLEEAGLATELVPLTKRTSPDPKRHNAVLIATSVRYGHFDKNLYRLVQAHRSWIDSVPARVVTISLTARKPEKRNPQDHVYTRKFLEKSGWAGQVEIVAGTLDYPRYNLFDRLIIQFIMRLTQGPTDPTLSIEYTDWDQVTHSARQFAQTVLDAVEVSG